MFRCLLIPWIPALEEIHGCFVSRTYRKNCEPVGIALGAAMAFIGRRAGIAICSELCGSIVNLRMYSSRVDWKQLRPMILKRIKNRSKDYPVKRMIPVAQEVFRAREILTQGVSTLLRTVPVHSCK